MIRTLNDNKIEVKENKPSVQNDSQISESNKKHSNKPCCVCLANPLDLKTLSTTDENGLSLLIKLKINIPQVVSNKSLLSIKHDKTIFVGLANRFPHLFTMYHSVEHCS